MSTQQKHFSGKSVYCIVGKTTLPIDLSLNRAAQQMNYDPRTIRKYIKRSSPALEKALWTHLNSGCANSKKIQEPPIPVDIPPAINIPWESTSLLKSLLAFQHTQGSSKENSTSMRELVAHINSASDTKDNDFPFFRAVLNANDSYRYNQVLMLCNDHILNRLDMIRYLFPMVHPDHMAKAMKECLQYLMSTEQSFKACDY